MAITWDDVDNITAGELLGLIGTKDEYDEEVPLHYECELSGDPFPFEDTREPWEKLEEPSDAELDIALMKGGYPLYETRLSPKRVFDVGMFTVGAGAVGGCIEHMVVVYDGQDDCYKKVRKGTELEVDQFMNMIGINGFHPNALPRRIH